MLPSVHVSVPWPALDCQQEVFLLDAALIAALAALASSRLPR